jgi:UDP-N-acetylmuramate--alanine ligase
MAAGIASFKGTKRRSEIVGEAKGVLFMDDYAHHPTAITTTLQGLRDFYPERRLVVGFMPHTWSRTKALLAEFAAAFSPAHMVLLHDIYASAREHNPKDISGEMLYERTKANHPHVHYIPKPMDALDWLDANLKAGDLFVTMGAGDNWQVGAQLFAMWSGTESYMEQIVRQRQLSAGGKP